jgi:hypothetical protein
MTQFLNNLDSGCYPQDQMTSIQRATVSVSVKKQATFFHAIRK